MSAVVIHRNHSLVTRFGERFGVDPGKLLTTLKNTCFKQGRDDPEATDEEMMALLVVADQYRLNPFTKEIYAFRDKKRGGIVPVVSIDGWARIINERTELDGIEFAYSTETRTHKNKTCHEWMDCTIYRKDRAKPTVVREFFSEVVRSASFETPWDTHPNRMHRHKALIQCARVAFGFGGIFDQDEAERIIEAPEPILVSATVVNPRGDQSGITDELCEPYIKNITDILNADKEEHEIAQMLREHDIEMSKFPEIAIGVADRLASRGIIKKAAYKKYLNLGTDRGETHTS